MEERHQPDEDVLVVSGIEFHACSMFATRLRWVSITPFIRPVVPLEYGRTARSSGSTSTSSGVAPGSSLRDETRGVVDQELGAGVGHLPLDLLSA